MVSLAEEWVTLNYKGTESFLQSVPTQFKPRLETRRDAASARWCFQPSSEILGRQQSAEEPRRRLPPVPALRSGGRRVNGACGLCFSPKIHAWPYAPKRHRFFSFTPLSIKVYRVAAPVGSKNAGSSTLCEGDPCVFSWSPVCVIYPQLLSAFYCWSVSLLRSHWPSRQLAANWFVLKCFFLLLQTENWSNPGKLQIVGLSSSMRPTAQRT